MEEVKQDQRLLPEVLTPLVNEIMEGASADRKDVRSQRVKAILESNCGKEPLEIANILTRKYHELYSESAPDEMVCAPEGCRSDHHVEGPEAGRHHGVIIRWVSGEWLQWRSDGGIYVGDGSKRLTASPLGQANRDRLDTRVARRLLEGRPLYIDEGDSLEMAQSTVDYFGLRGGTGQGPRHGGREYYQQVEAFLEGAMTTLQLGIVLKEMVRVRPSLLGTAVILMELCAVGPLGSSQPFQEVLPLPLPDDTEAEIEVRRVLEKVRLGQPEAGSKESLDNWVPVAGVDAWVWLQVVLLNYMYIGKDRLLTQTLFHSKTLLECQVPVMEKLKWNARTFGNSGESVRIGPWHDVSEQLGELYTGKEWRKCYPLTLRAIEPSIPKAGEAARVELASVLPERIREYAVNPALVRLDDDEVINPRYTAPVHVESPAEWDKIVKSLVVAGMFEAEVEEETVRHKGKPVLNGAFGVHKAWKQEASGEWTRCLRLIINLIPSNGLQGRFPERASTQMSYGPLFGQMIVQEGEVSLFFAEDQKHCFHIYRPGYAWRGYFTLSRKASAEAFGRSGPPLRPRVCSAPMGWKNIVDLIQVVHEEMGAVAGVPPSHLLRLGHPLPHGDLLTPRQWFSFYVDNFDQVMVVNETEVGRYEGKASEVQLQLRQVYHEHTVGRDPKKAAEGVRSWQTLGAEMLENHVGSNLGFRRALMGATLHLIRTEGSMKVSLNEFMTTVSKHMHSCQYNRTTACLLDQVYKFIHNYGKGVIPHQVIDELWLLTMALPMHWMNTQCQLDGRVWATDASEEGGGACHSVGLSKVGDVRAHLLALDSHCQGGALADEILVVELFGGAGGLSKALQLLGVVPMGLIFVDLNPKARKLQKGHHPHSMFYSDIKEITREDVLRWKRTFCRARRVLVCGGWPCVEQSRLKSQREGADSEMGRLLDDMLQIAGWLKEAGELPNERPWSVIELYENVFFDAADARIVGAKMQMRPLKTWAHEVGWTRRPRQFWLRGLALISGKDLTIEEKSVGEEDAHAEVHFEACWPALWKFVEPATARLCDTDDPFPCFTRPIKREQPPPSPAGLEQASEKALRRWKGDAYRLPPYAYEDACLVKDKGGPRRLKAMEQARMLGYNSGHFRNMKPKPTEDEVGGFTGNSFPVIVVGRLLMGLITPSPPDQQQNYVELLWKAWDAHEEVALQSQKATGWTERFGATAGTWEGAKTVRDLIGQKQQLPRQEDRQGSRLTNEQFLILQYCRIIDHRGSDVRFEAGLPYAPHLFARRPVDPSAWIWKVFLSYKWKETGHINALELAAVLDLCRKLARKKEDHDKRRLLLVDNQSVLSIIARGRTSSARMQGPLTRLAAVLLATGMTLVLGWVQSALNPADGPSRWRGRA